MIMETNDYVSYPIALALKKAGFDELCRYYYNPKGILRKAKDNALSPEALNNRYLDEIADGVCSAVPLWQAQKWLREEWGIHVYPTLESVNEVSYDCHIVYLRKEAFRVNKRYSSYESALSAGIAVALELIGEKGE